MNLETDTAQQDIEIGTANLQEAVLRGRTHFEHRFRTGRTSGHVTRCQSDTIKPILKAGCVQGIGSVRDGFHARAKGSPTLLRIQHGLQLQRIRVQVAISHAVLQNALGCESVILSTEDK